MTDPTSRVEQHFTQATRDKVFQHTIDRTSVHRTVDLLHQHRVHVHAVEAPATLLVNTCGNLLSRTDYESSCARSHSHLSLRLSGGPARASLSRASPPRLRSHLCPSVSLDLTLAHTTSVRRKESRTHLSGSFSSLKLRLLLNSLMILSADSILRTGPSASIGRASRPSSVGCPAASVSFVTFLTANCLSTF